jgi:hypothetical protein
MLALILAATLGTTNPVVTQANIGQTICVRGWATSIRPPEKATWPIKRKLLAGRPSKRFVLDHVVPLAAGGAPLDPANLQLQTVAAGKAKDVVEVRTSKAICAGRMTLQQGQAVFIRSIP